MKKNNNSINAIYTKFIFSFLLVFTLYIQVFGEISPGGGFQAGALFASAIIGYDLSLDNLSNKVKTSMLLKVAVFGFGIYLITGLGSVFSKLNFLNYSYLGINGQKIGIMLVEFGVGITVSASMLVIYFEVKNAS